MVQKQLSEMTIEELNTRHKALDINFKVMTAAVIIMFVCGIYLTVSKKNFNTFTVLPLAFLPLALNARAAVKKVREELARRKEV